MRFRGLHIETDDLAGEAVYIFRSLLIRPELDESSGGDEQSQDPTEDGSSGDWILAPLSLIDRMKPKEGRPLAKSHFGGRLILV
jgi:hypothetical protein